MSFVKKTLLTVLTLSLIAVILVSCGGNTQTPAGETTPSDATNEETKAATKKETAAATAEPTSTSPFENKQKPSDAKFEQLYPAPTVSKRDAVYNYMMAMATVEWTPSVDFVTTHRPDVDRDYTVNLSYKAGKTYYGVPYGETKANLEQFQMFLDSNNKFTFDSYYYQDIVGNHCSSCMFLAYQQIIPVGYGTLRPSEARKGIFKLAGNLKTPEKEGTWLSADCIAYNGKEAMYEGYAALDKGDILGKFISGSGHTRFVTKVEVTRSAAGKLMPSRSYVYVIENTNAWYDSKQNTTWWVDKKYTFDKLIETNFIPVTLDTYFDDNDKIWDAYIWFTGANTPEQITTKLLGKVVSNFPLNYVRVTIEDSNGNIVKEMFKRNLTNAFEVDIYRECYSFKLHELPAGTYKYSLKAGISRGSCEIESFEFTVK